MPNECIYPNLAIKLVAMTTSLEESERAPDHSHSRKYLSFDQKKTVKIGPVDPRQLGEVSVEDDRVSVWSDIQTHCLVIMCRLVFLSWLQFVQCLCILFLFLSYCFNCLHDMFLL